MGRLEKAVSSLALLVLGFGLWNCSGSGSKAPATDNRTNAWVMCMQAARQRLKSPGTADFGSVLKGTFQRSAETVTELGNDTYRCRGWVDAQNSFGAVVRTDFEITVKDHRDPAKTWSVVSFDKFDQR